MDVTAVNLNLLVALEALLDTRSVTAAARRIGLSQPATSHALAQLRALYGDPLLVRAPGGLVPTPLAASLAPAAAATLREVRALLSARLSFEAANAERRFRIAASDAVAALALDGIVRTLAERAPGCELVLKPHDHATTEALAAGDVDVVLAARDRLPEGPIVVDRLYRESWSVVTRTRGRDLDLDRYCRIAHVLIASDEGPGLVDRVLEKHGRTRRVLVRIPDYGGLGPLLAHTDLLATVPTRLAKRLAAPFHLKVHEPPVRVPGFDVCMAWHSRWDADPGARFLRECIRQAASTD